jgi:hypothetical protein
MPVVTRLKSMARGALWLLRGTGMRDSLRRIESRCGSTSPELLGRLAALEAKLARAADADQLLEAVRAVQNGLARSDARLADLAARFAAVEKDSRRQADRRRWHETNDLKAYERKVHSQNGEDGIIREIFRRIGTTNRYFIEFGVESGVECNCARLVLEDGWRGLFIEGNPAEFVKLDERFRPLGVTCVQTYVTSANIEQVFAEAGVPAEPDLLSIDIDGNDYWVWKAVENYRPRAVVLEYNGTYPVTRKWVMKEDPDYRWNRTNYFGASLASFARLGRRKGYELVGTDSTGVNCFLVREDLIDYEQFLDPALHYHYQELDHPGIPNGVPVGGGPFEEI